MPRRGYAYTQFDRNREADSICKIIRISAGRDDKEKEFIKNMKNAAGRFDISPKQLDWLFSISIYQRENNLIPNKSRPLTKKRLRVPRNIPIDIDRVLDNPYRYYIG